VLPSVCLYVCLSVSLSVCPLAYLKNYMFKLYFIIPVSLARSSSDINAIRYVLTLCTSGFADDVVFSHNGTNGPELKKTPMIRRVRQVAPLEAKCNVYDCLFVCV